MKYEREQNKLSITQLAEKFHLSEGTVRTWLEREEYEGRKGREVETLLAPYKDMIADMLSACPDYSSQQILQRVEEAGYLGSYSTVSRYMRLLRPPVTKAYFKLHFDAGDAVQIDFGCCGYIPFESVRRRLSVLVMTLCYSRLMYAEFVLSERQEHFLSCLENGFHFFGGVTGRGIVDNCKCAVLEHHRHKNVVFNARFLDFAGHYGFIPVACNPRSPHEKGRVENNIGYIKHNFMTSRQFGSLTEAQAALRLWLDKTANVRCHGTTGRKPLELFNEKEKALLHPLNPNRFDCATTELRNADKRCRVWFDGNSYSVPSRCAGKKITVKATADKLYIYLDNNLVALHNRSYERKREIVDPEHFADLRRERQRAKEQNLIRDFLQLGNAAPAFLEGLELKQLNPRKHLRNILILAETTNTDMVKEALEVAVEFQTFRSEYVENLVMRKMWKSGEPTGILHVPKAADLLKLKLEQPNLDFYNA